MTKPAQCIAVAEHPEFTSEYLDPFADPGPVDADGRRVCVKCGKRLYIRWGLAHGEVNCESCSWPGRFYHFINEVRIGFCLQYHPKVVKRRRKA